MNNDQPFVYVRDAEKRAASRKFRRRGVDWRHESANYTDGLSRGRSYPRRSAANILGAIWPISRPRYQQCSRANGQAYSFVFRAHRERHRCSHATSADASSFINDINETAFQLFVACPCQPWLLRVIPRTILRPRRVFPTRICDFSLPASFMSQLQSPVIKITVIS